MHACIQNTTGGDQERSYVQVQDQLKTEIEEIKASQSKIIDRIDRVTDQLKITKNTVEEKIGQVEHIEEKLE